MDLSPPKVDFEVHRTKLDPRRTHVESVGVRRSPRRTWWNRLGSTQVESAADSNLVQLEPRESASEPRGAAADSSPPVRAPITCFQGNRLFGSVLP